MSEKLSFWDAIAPYLNYIENNHLDLSSINKLMNLIDEPVLVIGAGQGLLVEELTKKGYKVDGVDLSPVMVKYAKERRGLELIQADARNLPFSDKSYRTAIIATGVVDFIEDEEQVKLIINEAQRVTQESGKVLVAFYGVHPASAAFLKRIGILTIHNTCRQRRMFELTRLKPIEFISTVKREGGMGTLGAIWSLLKMQMFLPKKERKMVKVLAKLWREVEDPDALIASAAESLPYRNREGVATLFERLGIPINEMRDFDTCVVVQVHS